MIHAKNKRIDTTFDQILGKFALNWNIMDALNDVRHCVIMGIVMKQVSKRKNLKTKKEDQR